MGAFEDRVGAVRNFNRFYTQTIGALGEGLLESAFTLTQARILYELAQRDDWNASGLARGLDLDRGYLSRILKEFEARGLISRRPCDGDGRQALLALTEAGREAFAPLETRSRLKVAAMLRLLAEPDQRRLVVAMAEIERTLGGREAARIPYLLRPHRPGDIGWITHRHGVLYAQEYGWDETFEALVAEIAARFIQNFEPKRECCWIAERDGELVGSVLLVEDSAKVARLRLLLVEPSARGLGIGRRLVDECVRFARSAGYAAVSLWTNDVLSAARRIYEEAGFVLVAEEPHRSFGHDLVGQSWELALTR